MYKKLKQWWDNIKTFIQKQRQLHREEVNIKDSLIASAEESKKQSVDSFLLKTRHLHMKAMNHDIHSLFCTLYLDISLFLANILLIV